MANELVFDGNQGIAVAAGDIINIIGDGINIKTIAKNNTMLITAGDNPAVSSIYTKRLSLPKTNPDYSEGVLYVDGKVFLHNFSLSGTSTYVGMESGCATTNSSDANVGIGYQALKNASSASMNVAISNALSSLVSGNQNVAIGWQSMSKSTNSNGNVSVGNSSGMNLVNGNNSVLLGTNSGLNYSSNESGNIIVGGNPGMTGESNTIRIGHDGTIPGLPASQKAFMTGIVGNVVDNGMPVYINTQTGQLGTQSASVTSKVNVKDVSSSSDLLYKLRPVSFSFKGSNNTSFGLIAQEVAKVFPDLVQNDSNGNPSSIKYMDIISLLINEIKNLRSDMDALKK